jgi:hypothetical protein
MASTKQLNDPKGPAVTPALSIMPRPENEQLHPGGLFEEPEPVAPSLIDNWIDA